MAAKMVLDPYGDKDFKWNWDDWLQEGESIASFVIEDFAPLERHDHEITDGGRSVVAWFKGSADGTKYYPDCKITTDSVPPRKESLRMTIHGEDV